MNEEEMRLATMMRAELCRVRPVWVGDFGPHKIAEALLPTVRQIVAAELRAAADEMFLGWAIGPDARDALQTRADTWAPQ